MALERPVCPYCGDTRVTRTDGVTAPCPFHDGNEFEPMDSETSAQIRARIAEHARRHPEDQISPAPQDWQQIAADPGRAYRALGLLLVVVCALIVLTVVVMVVSW